MMTEVTFEMLEKLRKTIDQLRAELIEKQAEAMHERRMTAKHFAAFEDMEKQRDYWRKEALQIKNKIKDIA